MASDSASSPAVYGGSTSISVRINAQARGPLSEGPMPLGFGFGSRRAPSLRMLTAGRSSRRSALPVPSAKFAFRSRSNSRVRELSQSANTITGPSCRVSLAASRGSRRRRVTTESVVAVPSGAAISMTPPSRFRRSTVTVHEEGRRSPSRSTTITSRFRLASGISGLPTTGVRHLGCVSRSIYGC